MTTERRSSGVLERGGGRASLLHQAGAPNNYTDLAGSREY